ncbi:MAG: fibronectin type III domain-containing protein, partial [Actinomycetota bacterium]
MRKTHRWTAIAAVALLLTSLGLVAPPTHVVRAETTISQVGSDIDGEAAADWSGQSVAMSGDGTRIAIGAPYNDGNGTNSGHVRVYTRTGTTWEQTGSDINGEAESDGSGQSVAMSRDGTTIAIGAPGNNGRGTDSGHVRVYTWNGTRTRWERIGDDIDGEAAFDQSGISVAMSQDGTRIAIGANLNDGNGSNSGHVRVYTLTNGSWTKTGDDIDGEAADDGSGYSVAMSQDGTRIAIGAPSNAGNGLNSGHVRVYTLTNGAWTQTGSDIDGEAAWDQSGFSIAMSEDGTRIAIGAPLNDDNGDNSGHVRIYTWNGTGWTQRGDDIDGEASGDNSGRSVAMSADGTRIAIGAILNLPYGSDKGRVRIYTWDGTAWEKTGSDIDGEAYGDSSGDSVAMSRSGKRIAIGATGNDNNNRINSGHVRVYAILSSPTAPTISAVTPTNGSLTVAFTPGTDGGSAITNYKYSVDGTNYVALNPATTTSPFTISGLTNGTTYSVTIKAVNEIGDSPASNAMTGVVPDVPSAPTISSVSANNGSLTIAFTPGTDGGSAITNYKYSVDGTNYVALNPATTTSPFTISGLTNSTTYSVTIKAVNGVGDSPVSNAITASPIATSTTQIGADIDGEAADDGSGYSVAMSQDGTRIAIGAPFNDGNGSNSGHVRVYTKSGSTWTQTGTDINGQAADDLSGWSVAMSQDGTRIAIGAPNGGPNMEGQVRVYTLTNGTWTQTGTDINGEAAGDQSGTSVAMSQDGTRIAIAAPLNDGNGSNSGQVRVYTLTNGTWTQTGSDIDGESADDQSALSPFAGATSVAMSQDGTRIAIGARQNDGNGSNSGHVRVYTLTNGAWTKTGSDIDGESADDESGSAVAMSQDGTRIAIGATGNDGNGNNAGHVRVYTLTNGAWTKTGSDIDGESADDESGSAVAMSQDGTRIAIGATGNDGNGNNAGHVRVYTLTNGAWTKTGSDIDGEAAGDLSGGAVAMSAS